MTIIPCDPHPNHFGHRPFHPTRADRTPCAGTITAASRPSARHRELYAKLDGILEEGGAASADLRMVRALLIAGLIRSAAELIRSGVATATVGPEVDRTATAVAAV